MTNLNLEQIEAYVSNETPESLGLDFKINDERDAIFTDGKLTKQGRNVFAKAISSLANSAGGRVVIGIKCKPDRETGTDCASEFVPLTDLAACLSSLSSVAPDLTFPSIRNLSVSAIESRSGKDTGFIVVEVPQSENRPHKANSPKNKGYYKRSASSSLEMEHYEIQDAFNRISTPRLILETSQGIRGGTFSQRKQQFKFRVEVIVENVGTSIAKDISVSFRSTGGPKGTFADIKGRTGSVDELEDVSTFYCFDEIKVPPGAKRLLVGIDFSVQINRDDRLFGFMNPGAELSRHNIHPPATKLQFDVSIHAENALRVRESFSIELTSLLQQVKTATAAYHPVEIEWLEDCLQRQLELGSED
jgi:hypothetical protein